MAYCTPAQLILRYDKRRCYELVSDSGVPVSAIDFLTDPVILAILEDATADVRMAVRRGNKYTLTQLDEIYADSARSSQLIRLTADLAFGRLNGRRGLADKGIDELAPFYTRALEMLELLSKGERILDDYQDLHAEAGVHVVNVDLIPPPCPWTTQAAAFFGLPNCGGGTGNGGGC